MSPKTVVLGADEELARALDSEADVDTSEPGEVTPEAAPPAAPITPVAPEPRDQRPAAKSARANLQESEDFRKFQAERDKREAQLKRDLEALKQRAEAAEWQARQIAEQQQKAQYDALESRMDDALEPAERAAIVKQMAAIEAQTWIKRNQEWENYKRKRIQDEGFEPSDARFARQYTDASQLEADLAVAGKERLKSELAEARQATSPAAIEKLVAQAVARALAAKGYDDIDLGSPTGAAGSEEAYQADLKRLQAGAMSPQKFYKKWGEQE